MTRQPNGCLVVIMNAMNADEADRNKYGRFCQKRCERAVEDETRHTWTYLQL